MCVSCTAYIEQCHVCVLYSIYRAMPCVSCTAYIEQCHVCVSLWQASRSTCVSDLAHEPVQQPFKQGGIYVCVTWPDRMGVTWHVCVLYSIHRAMICHDCQVCDMPGLLYVWYAMVDMCDMSGLLYVIYVICQGCYMWYMWYVRVGFGGCVVVGFALHSCAAGPPPWHSSTLHHTMT